MPRRPKLVHISILVPRMIRDELAANARYSRRSLSSYVANILRGWYDRKTAYRESKEHGDEKESINQE
jgi:hypothetical protein